MAEQDFFFQMTAEVMQQRLNQVPINTSAIEQEESNRQTADEQEALARQQAVEHEAQVRQQADEHLQTEIDQKQDALTFDDEPRTNSDNPVKSGGIKHAIDQMGATKQDTLTFDDHPTAGSQHPVTSGGIKSAIDSEENRARLVEETLNSTKQNVLHFDNTPTPDSTNPVTSGGIALAIRDFITKTVNDLTNYYLKSDTYSRTEVQQLVDAVKQFTYEKVATLPTASALTMNKIYLVPSPVQVGQNVSDEYITIATEQGGATTYAWEQIGTTTVDLSGYSTTDEMNAAINAALAVYSTTAEMNTAIAQALLNYYTKSELDQMLAQKQNTLTFDTTPTAASLNPVTSGGIKAALDVLYAQKQNQLTFDQVPTAESLNPVTSGGIKAALDVLYAQKQNQLTFDQVPTAESLNPVTSGGISQAIANFITASVDNLLNYYTKSETYTRTEIQQMISSVSQFDYKVVGALPTPSADTMHTIYLVPSTNPKTQNEKDEFITILTEREVEGQMVTVYVWEQIGSTTVDLSGYSTTDEMNAAINAALAVYSTTAEMNTAIAQALLNYYTKSELDQMLAQKQNTLTFDTTPTAASLNPVTSGGIKAALDVLYAQKQNQLTFDQVPTAESLNPVTSGGISQAIANFITASVDNLLNYYTKSETYTRTEIQQLISSVSQFDYKVVGVLPTPSADTMHTIYLVPSTNPKTQNEKDEFITIMTEREVEGQMVTVYVWEQIGSTTVDLSGYSTTAEMNAAINAAAQDIMALIPQDATSLNQLADKAWVSAQIAENAGTFRGTFDSLAELEATTGNHNNDYAFVKVTDQDGDNDYDRYKYNGTAWVFEYRLNNTHFTSAELAAIRSGITAALVSKLNALPTASELNTALGNRYTKTEADNLLAQKQAVITDGAQIGLGMGTCMTAVDNAAKAVSIPNFLLLKNMPVTVTFQNAINVMGATLNISSTGAKPVFIQGAALQAGVVKAGDVVTLIYDGTNWNIVQILSVAAAPSDLFVDMGLPSGRLWAIANIDVTKASGLAEVDGKPSPFVYECTFFSWGNTEGHNPSSTSAFDYNWGENNEGPYAQTPGAQLTANAGLSFDASRAILGAPWRDPSTEDFAELFANIDYVQADGETVIDASTTNKLVTVNSIVGIYLKSKINGKLLFFACSGLGLGTTWYNRGSYGYYWASSLDSAASGRLLYFYSGGVDPQNTYNRFHGFARRAVQ